MRKEEIMIDYYNSTISAAFFFPDDDSKKYPVVCKVHGLVSNEFAKEEALASLLTDKGIAYFVFHLSGFYKSTGETTIHASLQNLDYVISFLANHPKVNPLRIGLYGVSLGGALVTCHASRDPRIAIVALQAPLFDFDFVVNYPHFDALWDGLTASGLVRTAATGVKEKLQNDIRGNNPLSCVNRIAPRPLLIIAGSKDRFMPMNGVRNLYSNAFDPKSFKIIPNADHNLTNPQARLETFDALQEFFVNQLVEA